MFIASSNKNDVKIAHQHLTNEPRGEDNVQAVEKNILTTESFCDHVQTKGHTHAPKREKETTVFGGRAVNFHAISVALEEIWNLKKIEQDFYICVPYYSLIGCESWVKR